MNFDAIVITFGGAVGFVFGGAVGAAVGVAITSGTLAGLYIYVSTR